MDDTAQAKIDEEKRKAAETGRKADEAAAEAIIRIGNEEAARINDEAAAQAAKVKQG